ncbi:MAG: lipopolysaccharide transport periplasmic protein LptA [Gammaproteobacteria bacterium]|nr:lipopolysaccharide transport periplasmic protein LptA [Gammaproteobacteria bacterium]
MMRQQYSKLFITFLMLLPALALALPSDREKPIDIEADHAQLDDEKGVTQYKGTAILTQGSLRIEGDTITFYYDDDKQLTKAVAQGEFATYQQIQKPGEQPIKARALQMEYHAKSQKIYLLGKGHVWQQGDEFSGDHIEYDITKNIVNARSKPSKPGVKPRKGERIHIIIQPPGSKKKSKPVVTKAATAPKAEPITTPTATKSDAYPTAITTTNLHVRTGPGTQYNKLGIFKLNAELIILTEQKDWLQVRGMIDDQVVIGWVSRRYIQRTN